MDEDIDRTWQKVSEEVLSDVKQRRLAHPRASFRETGQAVEEQVNRLKARPLEDAALASQASDWREAPQEHRPRCPVCGMALQARGKRSRHLQTAGGHPIRLTRSYGVCPTCGTGLFPLDEELALPKGTCLTPVQQEHPVRLASRMPFAQAASLFADLVGIQVSEATTRRFTEQAGEIAQAWQTAQVCAPQKPSTSQRAEPRLVLSADGAIVPLLGGQWAEVRKASAAGASKRERQKSERAPCTGCPCILNRHGLPSMPEDNTETDSDPGGEHQGQKLEQAITRDHYSLVERYSLRATGPTIILLSLLHAFSPFSNPVFGFARVLTLF
jgi:hypothetical protein